MLKVLHSILVFSVLKRKVDFKDERTKAAEIKGIGNVAKMTNTSPTAGRRKSTVRGLFVLFACSIALIVLRTGEPRYAGRTLTSWLRQCADPFSQTNQVTEAQNAIRAIGATRSLPILLKLVSTKESAVDKWVLDTREKFRLQFLHWRDEDDCQFEGLAGFESLGTNAAPAVGTLINLLHDRDRAFVAARCLAAIGKPAEGALCQCLTNQDWRVRTLAISELASVTDDVEPYISRVKPCLNDPDSAVRFAAVQAIGAQDDAPDLAIPLLNEALSNSDDRVSEQAADAICSFGTNGAPSFSSLTNVIASGRLAPARASLKALAAVAPSRAVPILSNTVVNGETSLSGAALRSLKFIAPQLTTQMTLAEMHSRNPERRLQAVRVAATFEIDTPGIADALKSASKDNDPEVAQHANIAIKQMLQSNKERRRGPLSFPEDPQYQGKRLGDWLQMRHDGWALSTNAVDALRGMGTNAIPPLLRRLEYKDPVFGQSDFDVSMEGVSGLISLGDLGKPALPRLAELMDRDSRDIDLLAMIAALGTGRDAIPCLMKGLTNRFPDVRHEAAGYLTSDWSAPYPEARKQAVPYLVKLLSDPDEDVRTSATNELKELDAQSAAKAGIK